MQHTFLRTVTRFSSRKLAGRPESTHGTDRRQFAANERFRPNIVLSGLPAWDEDHIDTIGIGSGDLRLVKPCVRCQVTNRISIVAQDCRTNRCHVEQVPQQPGSWRSYVRLERFLQAGLIASGTWRLNIDLAAEATAVATAIARTRATNRPKSAQGLAQNATPSPAQPWSETM